MRYNGVDILSVHPAISINKEIPPGMAARNIRTISGKRGDKVAGVDLQQDEYVMRVNIAAKSRQEAWRVRALLAAWATSSGEQTALLEPTHWPRVAYNAIVKAIEPPEFVFSHATVEVIFTLPDPVPFEQIVSIAQGTTTAHMEIGGALAAEPVVTYTPANTVEGLEVLLDSNAFFAINGQISAGTEIIIDTVEGGLLIGGEHQEKRINYSKTDWRPGFTPGLHTLQASAEGTLQARWHNRWA